VASGGVALEHMVLLANTVGASPWFNIPHTADDAYIASMAAAVLASLRPDLKVYVEYSNEVWGTGQHPPAAPMHTPHKFLDGRCYVRCTSAAVGQWGKSLGGNLCPPRICACVCWCCQAPWNDSLCASRGAILSFSSPRQSLHDGLSVKYLCSARSRRGCMRPGGRQPKQTPHIRRG
jgi:hypothetical protein